MTSLMGERLLDMATGVAIVAIFVLPPAALVWLVGHLI